MGERRTSGNDDSVWQQSDDTEATYQRMGRVKEPSSIGLERGRGFIDWSGRIQSYDLSSPREKKRAYGLLREISERRISDTDAEGKVLPEGVRDYFSDTVLKNGKGELIPLFHATDNEFTVFEKGDFGFHIGSAEQVEAYINEKIRQGQDVTVYTDDGDAVLLTDRTAGKITYYNQNLPTDKEYASKLRAATHIDELAKVSRLDNRPIEPDRDGRHGEFAKGGWQYRTAYFADNDGRYYKIGISTALNDQGKEAYNIGKIKKIPFPEKSVSGSKAKNGKISFDNSISQSDNNVNTSIRSEQQKDTTFDKRFSVSRKQRGAEETLDSGNGSVVEYNHQNLTESGEVNVGTDTEALGERRTSGNDDSVWQQSDGSETAYRRMGGSAGDSRTGLERGRGLIDWSGRIQSYDLSSPREKKRAYGLLREISERRISDTDAEGKVLPEGVRDYFSDTVLKNEQGVLCAGASVYVNQLVKQAGKRE